MPASLAAASSSFSLGAVSRLTATAGKRAKPRASPRARPAATRAVSTEQETEQSTARAPTGDAKSASQVHISALADGVQIVRCVCQERLKFEVEYGMQRGSTDNSYIVKGDDKTALLDLPDPRDLLEQLDLLGLPELLGLPDLMDPPDRLDLLGRLE